MNKLREDGVEIWDHKTPDELNAEWEDVKVEEVLERLDGELAPK